MRIAILGAGKIGESLIAGLRSSDWADIIATSRREERAQALAERYKVGATTSNPEAIHGADVVVLAVKDRKSTRLNSSHIPLSRMPSSA